MRELFFDTETYSEAPLTGKESVGPWKYSRHESTKCLMLAWAFDDDEPQLWLPGMPLPPWVVDLQYNYHHGDPLDFTMVAWNDFFDQCILQNVLGWPAPPETNMYDTAADAALLSLPRSLEACGKAVGLPTEKAKDKEGKRLIDLFCKPNKDGERNLPEDFPEDWARFCSYCKQDVTAHRAVHRKLKRMPEQERRVWELDRRINVRGFSVDMPRVLDAIAMIGEATIISDKKILELTSGEVKNIGSWQQVENYVLKHSGFRLASTNAKYLETVLNGTYKYAISDELGKLYAKLGEHEKALYKEPEGSRKSKSAQKWHDFYKGKIEGYKANDEDMEFSDHIIEFIEERIGSARSSLAKYPKFRDCVDSADLKMRGSLRYHGAGTGRWAGNLVQPHNMFRPRFKCTDECIETLHHRDLDILETIFDEPLIALASCLRGMITASPGNRLVVSDFSQIESRVLAQLAGAQKKLDAFASGLDIYKVNAMSVYPVKYEDVVSSMRDVGKVIELACGFGGSIKAFRQFDGKLKERLSDKEVKAIVKKWRDGNPEITEYWYAVEAAALGAVQNPGEVFEVRDCKFTVSGQFLYVRLPSGRCLAYFKPRIGIGRFDNDCVQYLKFDTKTGMPTITDTYGGKLAENITQAVARDYMADRMLALDAAGYPIVLSVHDEVIADTPIGFGSLEEFNTIMKDGPAWAVGLPVDADGYETFRYRK